MFKLLVLFAAASVVSAKWHLCEKKCNVYQNTFRRGDGMSNGIDMAAYYATGCVAKQSHDQCPSGQFCAGGWDEQDYYERHGKAACTAESKFDMCEDDVFFHCSDDHYCSARDGVLGKNFCVRKGRDGHACTYVDEEGKLWATPFVCADGYSCVVNTPLFERIGARVGGAGALGRKEVSSAASAAYACRKHKNLKATRKVYGPHTIDAENAFVGVHRRAWQLANPVQAAAWPSAAYYDVSAFIEWRNSFRHMYKGSPPPVEPSTLHSMPVSEW